MRRADLVPDCGSCDALCCIAAPFDASDDFAISKAAGLPCPHLDGDHACRIHDRLAERGFSGCAIYDCYGAGPKITRALAGSPQLQRHAAFLALRVVHELLWQLLEAARLCPPGQDELAGDMTREIAALEALGGLAPAELIAANLGPHERGAHALLRRLGHVLRARPGPVLPVLSAPAARSARR